MGVFWFKTKFVSGYLAEHIILTRFLLVYYKKVSLTNGKFVAWFLGITSLQGVWKIFIIKKRLVLTSDANRIRTSKICKLTN